MKIVFNVLAIAMISSALVGCANRPATDIPAFVNTSELIAPNSISNYAKEKHANTQGIIADLRNQDIQVVQIGDTLRIIVPIDIYFNLQNNELNPERINAINLVAALLKHYSDEKITITGNTDNIGSARAKFDKSYQQAHIMAAYLWNQGIPLNSMRIIGAGDTIPIASNFTIPGSAQNRRIEITLG